MNPSTPQPIGVIQPLPPEAPAENPVGVIRPLGRIVFALRGSNGRPIEIPYRSDAQRAEHLRLHDLLTRSYVDQYPDVVIDVKAGRLEANGVVIAHLESAEEKANLEALRNLYHEMLGQKYSSVTWTSYTPKDRAPQNAPSAFRKNPDIQGLEAFKIEKKDVKKAQAGILNILHRPPLWKR